MTSIYLDDTRTPIEHPNGGEWTIVRNCEDFIATVSKICLLYTSDAADDYMPV
jgi:hypothetical protein